MSLFVAVTLVPVLCSKLLRLPTPVEQRRGLNGRLFTWSESLLNRMDDGYRRLLHKALQHRPTGAARRHGAFRPGDPPAAHDRLRAHAPRPTKAKCRWTSSWRWARALSAPRPRFLRLEQDGPRTRAELDILISKWRRRGFMGGSGHRGSLTLRLKPRAERKRSNEQIAQDLRVKLTGLPGVVLRPRASGGNKPDEPHVQHGRRGAARARKIRGHDLEDSRNLAIRAKALMDETPGIKGARIGREEGRPELAVRVDRRSGAARPAAERRREHAADERGRHDGGPVPRARIRVPHRRPAARRGVAAASRTSTT